MDKLLFGTAGIPISTPSRSTENGIRHVRELGLDAMELEFVHSVNISKEKAPSVSQAKEQHGIALTCHGQYYINLNAKEDAKIKASQQRIINAAGIANLCGAYSVTFHPAFYQGMDKRKVYMTVKKALAEVVEKVRQENNKIWIRPETTGKPAQFGDLHELLALSQELEQVMPCIDFSHLHARSNGKLNTEAEFSQILGDVEKALGKKALREMHMHLAGIAYSEKGEKNHLILKESDFNYKALLKTLKNFNAKGILICESPNIEGDAKMLKQTYEAL